MNLQERAAIHAALGDTRRLAIVDHLAWGDLTVAELAEVFGMDGNLLAHHLGVLETAGLIGRRVSEGDHRRRYVSLERARLPWTPRFPASAPSRVVFVCTRNSARSQFAAALWSTRTGGTAQSAGSRPSERVDPRAVRVATEYDVDLSGSVPGGYELLDPDPDLVVSVCDRARESGVPAATSHLHWSVPDPVAVGTLDGFRDAFSDIADRVGRLAVAAGGRG